jgi:hypothetical protein
MQDFAYILDVLLLQKFWNIFVINSTLYNELFQLIKTYFPHHAEGRVDPKVLALLKSY